MTEFDWEKIESVSKVRFTEGKSKADITDKPKARLVSPQSLLFAPKGSKFIILNPDRTNELNEKFILGQRDTLKRLACNIAVLWDRSNRRTGRNSNKKEYEKKAKLAEKLYHSLIEGPPYDQSYQKLLEDLKRLDCEARRKAHTRRRPGPKPNEAIDRRIREIARIWREAGGRPKGFYNSAYTESGYNGPLFNLVMELLRQAGASNLTPDAIFERMKRLHCRGELF